MLAGYQERAVLATLARQDHDAAVRAAACQYLAMIGRPEDEESWRVLHERLETDAAAEVRRATIAHLPPHTPASVRTAVVAATRDANLEVRHAAADKLSEWARLSQEGYPASLVAHLLNESDPELRQELMRRWRAHEGAKPLLESLRDASDDLVLSAVELCVAHRDSLPWEDLQPFALRGHAALDVLLMGLLQPEAPAAAEAWLLKVALRYWRAPSSRSRGTISTASWDALECLRKRFEEGRLNEPEETGGALARELLDAMETDLGRQLAEHVESCDEPEHGDACGWDADDLLLKAPSWLASRALRAQSSLLRRT
jgi:hypothetical protein